MFIRMTHSNRSNRVFMPVNLFWQSQMYQLSPASKALIITVYSRQTIIFASYRLE
jgi:hypothetical protein